MTLLLLVSWGTVMTVFARLICGSWANHLSLYSFVWTLSVGFYELHWVRYNPISDEAWLYIFIAWIAIYLGTALVTIGGKQPVRLASAESLATLKNVILLFSLGGVASSGVLAWEIMKEIDPNLLVAITVGAPRIYAASFEETGEFGGIPYLSFLPFAACALAGIYAARKRRIDWVSGFPLLVNVVSAVLSVSRWTLLLSGVLFVISFFLTPKSRRVRLGRIQKLSLVLLVAAGIVAVSLTRTDLGGGLAGETGVLDRATGVMPFASSLYFYISGPAAGFSSYLRDASQEANQPWGRFTFASIYRLLSKVGLASSVPFHQEFYSTPEPINTCTYLREVHSDFGAAGVFLFPLVLGMAAGWLSNSSGGLLRTVLLTHLYVVVFFSFTYLVVITGQWFQSLVFSTLAATVIEKSRSRARGRQCFPAHVPSMSTH